MGNLEDKEDFQRLLGTLKDISGIAITCREDGETRYPIFIDDYRKGREIITIFFDRKYVEFRDRFGEIREQNDFSEFLAELRRQRYSSNHD